ncbi:hypothetical protein EEB13_07845 [Rhodococcus sp. WS3]|nr:hypothetical protein EEB13_07845 [Rhodococcus sp. WS3]
MLSRESLWTEYAAIELHRVMMRFQFELVPVDEVEPSSQIRNQEDPSTAHLRISRISMLDTTRKTG